MTVVIEQSAQALAANYVSGFPPDLNSGFDDSVIEALMVPLSVIVVQIFADRGPQRSLAEEDHSLEYFLFQRPEKPFEVRIAVAAFRRQ